MPPASWPRPSLADRRDPHYQRTWIALADGNKDQIRQIRAQATARGIHVTILIDIIHVTEYLWGAAWCWFPEASPDAGAWVRDRVAAILDGRALQAAAALRDAAAIAQLSVAKHRPRPGPPAISKPKPPGWTTPRPRERVAHLHRRHRRRLPPPGQRPDGHHGARWGIEIAEAILQLRALHANGDFDEYWPYHLHREHERNHPHSYALAA